MARETHIRGRIAATAAPFVLAQDEVEHYEALDALGISFRSRDIQAMSDAMDADVPQPLVGAASIATPVQFLQNWLPGLVRTITALRTIDELVGITIGGSWSDEEVVQQVLELTGSAVPYGDHTNVPLTSWNLTYERRGVVRFEQGFNVGRLEADRTSRIPNMDTAAEKRGAVSVSLEILRNRVGFYGYVDGDTRVFGYLNDPNLPAYVTVANPGSGTGWSVKTFLQITADIRMAVAALRTQSGSQIDPAKVDTVLGIASAAVDYLSVTSDFGISVADWLSKTYPKMRVVASPELDGANGGANVFYLAAEKVDDGSSDGGRVFEQIVPAKFQSLGVEQRAKSYLEDYTNALGGVMLKRPWAVVRRSGI